MGWRGGRRDCHDDDRTRGRGEHDGSTRIGRTAGEILVTVDAATAAGLDSSLEHRPLELKGKQDPIEVVTLTVSPTVKS